MAGNLVPRTDGGSDLGTALKEYGKIFVKELAGTAGKLYAKLASPAFTGTPTAPTALPGTNTTQIATTAFVEGELENYVKTDTYRKPSTLYDPDDRVSLQDLPAGWFLECSTGGTTDSGAITAPSPLTEGATITDGTVIWKVRRAVCENDYSKESFGTSVINHLLGSTLASIISAVSKDSVFSKLLKLSLEATGLRYSMGTNGYICLGSLFGNLILQWGYTSLSHPNFDVTISFPISFPADSYGLDVIARRVNNTNNKPYTFLTAAPTSTGFTIQTSDESWSCYWIAIGY